MCTAEPSGPGRHLSMGGHCSPRQSVKATLWPPVSVITLTIWTTPSLPEANSQGTTPCIKSVTAFPARTCQACSPIGTQGCEAKLETETPTQRQELPGWHPVFWLHWVKGTGCQQHPLCFWKNQT